jgi:hypothetical protein
MAASLIGGNTEPGEIILEAASFLRRLKQAFSGNPWGEK